MREVTMITPSGTSVKKRTRVAAYCRVSTNSADQLNSYTTQIRVYTDIVSRKPEWQLIEVFADEGISGTAAEKRDEFMRMIRMCEQKKIDLILCKSVSRFARNTKEALEYIRKLKLLGIAVQFEKEGINTLSLGDEMLLNTFAAIAQEESISISQNIRLTNKKRMSAGSYISGNAPYGYRLINGELTIYEPEAAIVRKVFIDYANGKSISEIAHELSNSDILTKYGRCNWKYDVISYMLSNERYIGDVLYQKFYNTPTIPFIKKKNRGEEDQYYATDKHPAIIDKELFNTVQDLLNNRREKFAHATKLNIYPLTSRIRCSECGSFYRRRITNGCISWGCANHISDKTKCETHYYREERIYDAFIRMVNKLRFSGKGILEESLRLLDLAILMQKKNNTKALEASQSLAGLHSKLLVIEQLQSKGYLTPEVYHSQTKDIYNQISRIKNQRAELLESKFEELQKELKELKARLDVYEYPIEQFDEELFRYIIRTITIDKQGTITFTIIGNLSFSEVL